MNVLDKAEKALEFLKANEATAKSHELQANAGTLGRCLGALGSRPNYARHYANLLHSSIPTLLFLASNNSAEVRLVGDEALNRAVVGGFAFHSHKTNIILQNQIEYTKNARWIRAALSRICLGECWLRPGVGKIRSQAQALFPRLSEIVARTSETQLIVEALESNLPRILDALAEYTTDEEIADLCKSLLSHVSSPEPAVRRAAAACAAHLTAHRETLLTDLLAEAFGKLWPLTSESVVVLGWFCVIKAVFQVNDVSKFIENNLFTVRDYLELYQLCVSYIEASSEHGVQNCVMECLATLLSCAPAQYARALLETHPAPVCLDQRQCAGITSQPPVPKRRFAPAGSTVRAEREPELSFSGALHLGSVLQLYTPSLSCEDLSIQTPDSPESETELELNTEQLSKELTEKLHEFEDSDKESDHVDFAPQVDVYKVNIGSSADDDVPLKFCARMLASKFLLLGNKGQLISDRSIRVSVKASALNCLSEILKLYPQAITLYLDKDADLKNHNISGSSDATDSNQDNANEFILERNVCYQESLSDSISHDLLKSVDSNFQRKLEKLEKSTESEQKSSNKDVQSTILDSKYAKSDLIVSAMSQDTNMTNSNFTSNSNTTDQTTGYPMSSSGDILSSSIDLDMKFDHFGESTLNLDTPKSGKDTVKVLKQPKEPVKDVAEDAEMKCVEEVHSKEFECQHMSDVFNLFEGHSDPQIRGLVRVSVGDYLAAALSLSQGDYNRWCSNSLPKDVGDCLCIEKLVEIVLKGLSDEIHSTVNHTLSALVVLSPALADTSHWTLLIDTLNALVNVERNGYWLCKVNLCKLYEKLPYQKLFMLYPDYHRRSRRIMDALVRLLADQDQKVRHAATKAITSIIPTIFPSRRDTPTTALHERARQQTQLLLFDDVTPSLNLVREIYFYSDLPEQLKDRSANLEKTDTLRVVVSDLAGKLMASNCKYYSQGLLETLQALTIKYSPWRYADAYSDQGILSFCLDSLECCNGTVACRTVMLDICRMLYPVEIYNVMRHKTSNRDIFERDSLTADKWQHLDNPRVAILAEKFLRVSLKMLNVLVHLIEEVNPNVHLNKGGIALPGSPVRRKTQESIPLRKGSVAEADEKRKKVAPAASLKAHFSGHFFTEPFYMKLYESLRAVYNNHKINLDPKTSIFHTFLTTVLHSLAIQLELATEREFGHVTEEILFYLKVMMPFRADLSVYCVTQLLKCLFGTNMISQYQDFATISDKANQKASSSFFDDVMQVNGLKKDIEENRRGSVCSSDSQRVFCDGNPSMAAERQLLMAMENFAKNKSDRKWSTNKKELERYIRLFEPVVIQSLKSYTMQNDIPLQCQVLRLLNQLLTLRVNYCMLDSDQIFIGFLMKQLDLVEQHEIPKCSELVNNILTFLVQLSSSRHHSKQIIEIPKLIQLCDGLMAAGAHAECVAGLEPVAVKVFSNMGGSSVLGRAQQQEAQATREVLFYMLQKTMHQEKVLNLVSCVLALSQEHPESYYRWSELASDTILALLAARSVELETAGCAGALGRLLERISSDALLDQPRVEMLIRILFQAPPETDAPFKLKLRYLAATMVLLREYLTRIPESEILLTIDYLKATGISPKSIFFDVKADCDPLNVQNVNENCANLSPDVVLVRFLFKTLTYAIQEVEGCYEDANLDCNEGSDKAQSSRLMYTVCVNIIVHVKHMLHLTSGCLFPLTSKTAQSLLHNEQSGLNTGLYSPAENIPLDNLNAICLKAARRAPCLTLHWSHLLIRLNFLSHKYWQKLVGFARNLPLSGNGDAKLLTIDILQVACVLAYCEYFIDNGLSEAVHLTWLIVNRICILVLHWKEALVRSLLTAVQAQSGAAGLLLQAVAARCQHSLKEEFALNTYKILSLCHESQSGSLVFFICRIIGKLEPSVAARFAQLATDRCKLLKDMPADKINAQLSKEDVQVALELLQRDKVHMRYSSLVMELNSLASTVFDLSPLDLSQDRAVNPQYIHTTAADGTWLLNQVKSRCCISECTAPKVSKRNELACLLANLSKEDLTTIMACPEFDRKLLSSSFKVACDQYLRQFINTVALYETKETERDIIREQQAQAKIKEEMTSSIDSNKLNVVNSTLHVFKKSDNKESKSQFFIPISENENLKESFGNLQISDEETELVPPQLSELYQVSLVTFDKSLTDVIRLFPKQNRPLSQSENFNLNVEQTIDRYTRRCHQVFQDKLFYQEFMTIQTIMTGFLDSLDRIIGTLDETDCELLDKCMEYILPMSLAKNVAIFSVISLQYLSFLIKNKSIVETPIHADVSFRVTVNVTDNVVIDNVVEMTVENVAKALSFDEIWTELNVDNNLNRSQSAISCLYAIVKYLVKDTQPLILHNYIQTVGPKPEMAMIGDKLVSLLQYWEENVYASGRVRNMRCMRDLEKLTVRLSRLDVMSSIALIPPIAWSSVDMTAKKDFQKVDLPLQALQDADVLEAFLFRVNLIGWSSKKQFEEMWVGLLGALQGNGPHWAVRGITQLLATAAPSVRARALLHVPRDAHCRRYFMQRLRNILMGTSAYQIFDAVNLERVPLINDGFDGYHCAQYNVEYLKLASGISECGSFRIRRELKRLRRNKELDLNSCLQILMDVTTQMLDPKADTGVAARVALINLVCCVGGTFSSRGQWGWAGALLDSVTGAAHAPLAQYASAARALLAALALALAAHQTQPQELSSVHQKLIKALSSGYAPLRQAALQGCLLQLAGPRHAASQELLSNLNVAVRQHLSGNSKISLYEQSVYWTVLFTLVELGHPDLVNLAVDFILKHPRHYCTDLVVKGITTVLRQRVLPKDLKNSLIERLLDNMKGYAEHHAVQILMVHLFSADDKLLSPRLTCDVSNMDPDVLMNSMERITLLYKVLKQTHLEESRVVITSALKYFLRETLPPAATLSRVMIEFVECCKEAEGEIGLSERESRVQCSVLNAELVHEVFETSITQDQLPVLSGWIFEALTHLLNGKISHSLTPYCVLTLLVSASSNQYIRNLAPLCFYILKLGFEKCAAKSSEYNEIDTENNELSEEAAILSEKSDKSIQRQNSVKAGHCTENTRNNTEKTKRSIEKAGHSVEKTGHSVEKTGHSTERSQETWGIFKDIFPDSGVMSFQDRRLLCVVALKSNFTRSQLERLREMCDDRESLDDLKQCLAV